MRGGPEFTRSLSGGMKAPKVVGLALVENVRVPGGIMPSKRVEGENPLSPDFKGFGVRCLGTFWAKDAQCLLLRPAGWGLAWRGFFGARQPRPSLGTQEAPGACVV
jgi:hypothetical protein